MLITAYFRDRGKPKTGLRPTINIWKSDGTLIIDAQVMAERAGGFYDYDFTDYDNTEDYTFLADGGSSLSNYDRYVFGTNESEYDVELTDIQSDIVFLKDIEGGRWKIDKTNKKMLFYKIDNTTLVATFNLFDENGNPAFEDIFERRRV